MICGIGIDITEIQRIKNILQRHDMRFVKKILTPEEVNDLQQRGKITPQSLAARFAAKEAAAKALGTGFAYGITLHHMALMSDASGKPHMHFYGPAAERMKELGANKSHVSLTHSRDSACAVIILERLCQNS